MARIVFKAVTKRYAGDVLAVRDLNLEIRDKEFVVLLGPSGCGKSTTLNMIAGLEEVTDGELWFDDQVVNALRRTGATSRWCSRATRSTRTRACTRTSPSACACARCPKPEIDARVKDAADKLAISHLLQRRPSQLSGGQRQRVALGRAMVRQPAVFLMDEPLSNLDAALRISMRAEIKHLHTEMQTTFVYVTHDQAEALTLADRIVVMNDGVIQQIGTPDDDLRAPPQHLRRLVPGQSADQLPAGRDRERRRQRWRSAAGRCAFRCRRLAATRMKGDAGRDVMLGIRPEDVATHGLRPDTPTLRGAVDSVLPVGSDRFLGLKVEGCNVYVRVDKESHHREGETVTLGLVPERLHLFDKASGDSLLADVAQ